jgi:hypothetical protein
MNPKKAAVQCYMKSTIMSQLENLGKWAIKKAKQERKGMRTKRM